MELIYCTIARVAYCLGILLLLSLLISQAIAAGPATSTTTQLTVSPSTAAIGARFTFVATVKDAVGEPVANGSVTFYDGAKALGTTQVVTSTSGGGTIGTATYKTFFLPLGSNVIMATYKGAGAGSTSAPEKIEVTGKYPSETVLLASGTEGNYVLTGTVSGAGPDGPTGLVTFTDAEATLPLGSAVLDPKTLIRSFPPSSAITCPEVTFGGLQVAVADLNGDGIPDLLAEIATYPSSGLIAMLGNGDGTYRCGGFTADPLSNSVEPVVIGDFDGDGKLDVIVPEDSYFSVYLGKGDGTFKTPKNFGTYFSQISAYDMNGDGILDIVGQEFEKIDVLIGNPDGTFQPAITTATSGYSGLTIGDFNRDGKLDIVLPENSGIDTLFGNGNGTFQAPVTSTAANFYIGNVKSSDLNGDGKLDLVLGGNVPAGDNGVAIMLGKGDGTFGDTTLIDEDFTTRDYPEYPLLADMNGDGILDVIAPRDEYPTFESDELFYADILYGKGDGTFQPVISYPILSITNPIQIADVNSDGKQDLVGLSDISSSIAYVYFNQLTETATLTDVTLPGVTTDKVTAEYAGDDSFANSTSNALVLASESAPLAPVFSLAAGSYSSTQTLTISESTPDAVVYYTTDGTSPSTASISYKGPIEVTKRETIKAVAIANGISSALTVAAYVIEAAPPQCATVDYTKGFTTNGIVVNGSAKVTRGLLELTDGGYFEAGSAYFATPLPANNFETSFTFELLNPAADGITFVIQAVGPHALGGIGGGLGYSGIRKSVALKFDLYNNGGEGPNSSGTYLDGASPAQPSISLEGTKVDLHSGHSFRLHIAYDGKLAVVTLTDTVTHIVLMDEFPGNIPEILGSSAGYFGFTGGTGSRTAIQQISAWSYAGGLGCEVK